MVANFASTLDGVVSLSSPGASSGGEITGFDPQDRLLMGILRALADVVIVGAGTLRAVPRHTWTAQHVYPRMADEFRTLRRQLGKPPAPRNVVVSASGRLDLRLPLFVNGEAPVDIITTAAGARRLGSTHALPTVRVVAVRPLGLVRAVEVLSAVGAPDRPGLVLIEGGPHLLGTFLAEELLDELFLTLAPQIAGRDGPERPGLVAGRTFAPAHPLWGSLSGIRTGEHLVFLRFTFKTGSKAARTRTRSRSSSTSRREA